MTRAETISLALDAGFNPMTSEEMDIFVAFANLVAQHEREKFCAVLRQLHDSYSLVGNSNAI